MEEDLQPPSSRPPKVQTGVLAIDALFDGGLPEGSNILLYGEPMCGKKLILMHYIYEGLKSQIPALLILTDFGREEWKLKMQQLNMDITPFEKSGLLKTIDCYSKQFEPSIQSTDFVKFASNASSLSNISLLISAFQQEIFTEFNSYRVAFHSLSSILEESNPKDFYKFMQFHAGKFRKSNATCLFVMEKGMHNAKELTTVEHLMNGTIEFEGSKIKPKGLGVVSDWWDYSITDNGVEVTPPHSGSSSSSSNPLPTKQNPHFQPLSTQNTLAKKLKVSKD